MKNFIFLLLLFILSIANSQVINFTDLNLKNKLLSANNINFLASKTANGSTSDIIDTNNNQEIEVSEAQQIKRLYLYDASINNLSGIENFINLEVFSCQYNNITSLNINNFTNLKTLNCNGNQISSLNFNLLPNLKILNCNNNLISSLELNNTLNLQLLECKNNLLTSLNVNMLNNLSTLNCSNNILTSLTFESNMTKLYNLDCSFNQLTSLNLNYSTTDYNNVFCQNNFLTNVDLSNFNWLQVYNCSHNLIANLSSLPMLRLQNLDCSFNQISTFDNNLFQDLKSLDISDNLITTLNISNQAELNVFLAQNNPNLTSLYMKNGVDFYTLILNNNPNLNFVCADASNLSLIAFELGNPNATITSNCALLANEKFNLENAISVYPNPSTSKINIYCNNKIKSLELLDAQGRILETIISTNTIDISDKSNGIYFLKINTDKITKIEKIVRE